MNISREGIPFLLSLVFLFPMISEPAAPTISALAPVEVVVDGLKELVGVVVAEDGTLYFSDRGAGVVYQFALPGLRVVLSGLGRPAGLALDQEGRLLIAEEKAGRILRLESDGFVTVLATEIKTPRWIAVASDGALYVSAHRLIAPGGVDVTEGREILRLVPGGSLTVVASDIRRLEGLVLRNGALIAATKGLENEAESAGMLLRYPVLADGSLGVPLQWLDTLKEPVGLVSDRLSFLYVSAQELPVRLETGKRAIGKAHSGSRLSAFADELHDPQGMALDLDGSLYLADGKAGRLIRFAAPPAPLLVYPAFTSQSPLMIQGTTEPNARLDAFLNDSTTPITLSTTDGSFNVTLDLLRNALTSIAVFSTAYRGDGLTSAPAEFTIVHDNMSPLIAGLTPPNGTFLNNPAPQLRADFSDSLSGVDTGSVEIQLDSLNVTSQAKVRSSGFTLTPINPLSGGSHPVSVTISDRAGNVASATSSFTVDVTPPETQIVGGPEGSVSGTSVTFMVTGTDNVTPVGDLQFAWRLDDGPFSSFGLQTQITLSGLTDGVHTFEVIALDLAGNVALNPARRTFTVSRLQVRITAPTDGASVAAGLVLFRGTVEAGGQEVGVSVNGFPAFVSAAQWAVEVPLEPGSHTISNVAVTLAGAQATTTITVNVSPVISIPPLLRAVPNSGVAPLEVTWEVINQTGRPLVRFEFDRTGTGIFAPSTTDFTGVQTTYTTPGLLFPTLRATDDQGATYTATTIVHVEAPQTVATRFQGLWTSLKARLQAGDLPGALAHLAPNLRPRFETVFQQLGPDLPAIVAGLGNLEVLEQVGELAETAIVQQEEGVPMLYFIYFRRDSLGRWLIEEM